jgi:probable rRNA maturation factor
MKLSVTVTDARGRRVRDYGLAGWLRRAAPAKARGAVGIALVTDAAMRRLNRVYRRVDKATDVLSFPAAPYVGRTFRSAGRAGPKGPAYVQDLGDLAIATGVARRQAREQGHPLSTELRILALHGLLHLLGYDHERDSGQMQRAEERLRRRAGLPVGLIRRPR